MFFKKRKDSAGKKTGGSEQKSAEDKDAFKEVESLEKKALKSLSDEEIAKAIKTVLRKSKLS